MVNLELLEKEIKESGLKLNYLADKLDISYYGLSKKLKGLNEFKLSEVQKLSKLLKLNQKTRNTIFFNQKREK